LNLLVAYTENYEQCPDPAFDRYLSQLPGQHREQVLKYRFREDAQACLYGKLLLQTCLADLGVAGLGLENIKYTSHQRPYFDSSAIDFNLSHSGGLVVCAIAANVRLGIDIEQIKPIDVNAFEEQFSNEEMFFIREDESLLNFYSLWTKKEALIKADGKGLSIPLKQVVVRNNNTTIEDQRWFLTEIRIADGYCCHLSTDVQITAPVPVKKYTF
jgi:4'-phosphopantetheinyl transferase